MALDILAVTGTRADWGLLVPILRAVRDDAAFRLRLAATGQHLIPESASLDEIKNDGFAIDHRVDINLTEDLPLGVTKSMGLAVMGFAELFDRARPDLILLLGDRFEIHAVASAALVAKIPVAHLCGGDLTEGAIDDAFRHGITKMSHLHFVTSDDAAQRVVQLGEDPERVFTVGSPAIDRIRGIKPMPREAFFASIGLQPQPRNLMITFHPVTLADDSEEQCQAMLGALEPLSDIGMIFTGSNSDPGARTIETMVENFACARSNAVFIPSLGIRALCHGASPRRRGRRQFVERNLRGAELRHSHRQYRQSAERAAARRVGDRLRAEYQGHRRRDRPGAEARLLECKESLRRRSRRRTCGRGAQGNRRSSKAHRQDVSGLPAMTHRRVVIIAEAGVNHNGSLQTALDLVDAAAEAGADIVKFQTFKADALASASAPKAAYQIGRTGNEESQLEMLRRLELPAETHRAIIAHCAQKRIRFLSSAFDLDSLALLVDEFGLEELKFGSGELTNAPLLLAAARMGCRLIVSTGMSTLAEVEQALGVIAFGFTEEANAAPGPAAFAAALTRPRRMGRVARSRYASSLHDGLSGGCDRRKPPRDGDTARRVRAQGRLFRSH